jgi:hypothetical protein
MVSFINLCLLLSMLLSFPELFYRELIILRKFNMLMELHTGSCFWRMSK